MYYAVDPEPHALMPALKSFKSMIIEMSRIWHLFGKDTPSFQGIHYVLEKVVIEEHKDRM